MKKPAIRNLCPYQVLRWHKVSTKDRFTKKEFLESNPNIRDIEEWNYDALNESIKII